MFSVIFDYFFVRKAMRDAFNNFFRSKKLKENMNSYINYCRRIIIVCLEGIIIIIIIKISYCFGDQRPHSDSLAQILLKKKEEADQERESQLIQNPLLLSCRSLMNLYNANTQKASKNV